MINAKLCKISVHLVRLTCSPLDSLSLSFFILLLFNFFSLSLACLRILVSLYTHVYTEALCFYKVNVYMHASVCVYIISWYFIEQWSLIISIAETIHKIWVKAAPLSSVIAKVASTSLPRCRNVVLLRIFHFSFCWLYHPFYGWNGLRPRGQVHFVVDVSNCEAAWSVEDDTYNIW